MAHFLRISISLWRFTAVNNSKNVNKNSQLEQIRALSFVKNELELYLDTHPNCPAALEYYEKTVDELDALTKLYEGEVAPLTASGVNTAEGWTWIKTPWPWQYGNGAAKEERK